jgi:hypothetical protein
VHSILYWVDKSNPLGAPPANPNSDPQFHLWETAVQRWAANSGYSSDDNNPANNPQNNNAGTIQIESPQAGVTYKATSPVVVRFSYQGNKPIDQAEVRLNNRLIGTIRKSPWEISFTPENERGIKQVNDLKVVIYDTDRNRSEKSLVLNLSDL